jgi:hypothetical protein
LRFGAMRGAGEDYHASRDGVRLSPRTDSGI